MKYLQATQIRTDLCLRVIVKDDQSPYSSFALVPLFSLNRLILILASLWFCIYEFQIFIFRTGVRLDQAMDNIATGLAQLIHLLIPVPFFIMG